MRYSGSKPALDAAERAVAEGEVSAAQILDRVDAELSAATLGKVDYAELRDPVTLEPSPALLDGPALLALAVQFDPGPDGQGDVVRLIDSRVLRRTRAEGQPIEEDES
jgi:pantothenate synthetase